jgi:hypothetical protein
MTLAHGGNPMRPCPRPVPFLLVLGVALVAQPAAAVTGIVRATDGVTSIALEPQHLEALGLSLAHVRETAQLPDEDRMVLPGSPVSFRIDPGDLSFRIKNGGFAGFVSEGPVTLHQQGGFSLAAKSMGRAVSPAFLYDFGVRLDPSAGDSWVKLTSGDMASPFDVRCGSALFLSATNELRIPMADLLISESYAKELGRPELAGDWIGTFDLRLSGTLERVEAPEPDKPVSGVDFVDVKLGQLYGIDDAGRTGTYPTGMLGLAFATTSCNVGTLDVPWLAPMQQDHPTIGMALFRIMNDRLEMVGQSWCKHGFFALSSSQCTQCQHPSDGSFLGVGCSDTYAFSNNSSQFYLGPRSEINPFTASWRCLGSYFDGQPVDCVRSFFGNGLDGVQHRLEVAEADLALPGATYFYEGVYYVRSDVDHTNNVGWRQCTMNFQSGSWIFTTVGGGVLPNPGPVIATWGDVHDTAAPDPIDGEIMSATKVTDLGNGQWHYEIALYNRSSDRGVREVSIPVGGSNLANIGFHDPDQDPANQWNAVVANGNITFSTGDFGAPGSNPLTSQKLFNFRFDADHEPIDAQMTASLYKPGDPMTTVLDIQAPNGAPTDVVVTPGSSLEFALRADPNPFAEATRVSFVMPTKGTARLEVLDVTGRSIRTLVNGEAAAGSNLVEWNGRDDHGNQVVSGVYFFRIESNGAVRTIKGTLLR